MPLLSPSRLVQLITSIVAFSTVVDYDVLSRIQFVVSRLGAELHAPRNSTHHSKAQPGCRGSSRCTLWPVPTTHPPTPADVHRYHRLYSGPVLHGAVHPWRAGGECRRCTVPALHRVVCGEGPAVPEAGQIACACQGWRAPPRTGSLALAPPSCTLPQARGIISLVIDIIWTIFWLSVSWPCMVLGETVLIAPDRSKLCNVGRCAAPYVHGAAAVAVAAMALLSVHEPSHPMPAPRLPAHTRAGRRLRIGGAVGWPGDQQDEGIGRVLVDLLVSTSWCCCCCCRRCCRRRCCCCWRRRR